MNPSSTAARLSLALVLFVQVCMLETVLCRRSISTITMRERSNPAFVPTKPTTSLSNRRGTKHSVSYESIRLMAVDPVSSSFVETGSTFLLATAAVDSTTISEPPLSAAAAADNLQIEPLDATTTTIVFIIGIIPFIWATYEFWRRIAVGASFGTGSDSVVIPSPFDDTDDDGLIAIGEDGNPNSSRGRQTLDRGALTVAYILFAVAGGSVAIAVASVIMGPTAPM